MKGDRVGEFEELTLLAVRALGEPTYAVPVQRFIEKKAGRPVSMGAVYAVLGRLENKALLQSTVGAVTPRRGGKRKRLYEVTPLGMRALRDLAAAPRWYLAHDRGRAPMMWWSPSRPPLLGRMLLRLRRLGERRDEIETDLQELFFERVAERGRWRAALRHVVDAGSLWIHREWSPLRTVAPRSRRGGGVLLDMKFAVRIFRRQFGVVSVTVGGLALAIGATTVIFGYLNAVMLRPFGGSASSSVVTVSEISAAGGRAVWWRHADYLQLREGVDLVGLEAYMRHEAPLGDAAVEKVRVTLVSGGYFETFGIRATIGRVLTAADDAASAPRAVVVNHGFWRGRLGGDESIIGETVRLMGTPFTVVGVIEPEFAGPLVYAPAFWAPLALAVGDPAWMREPGGGMRVEVIGRLADGAAREQAEAEVSVLVAGLAVERLGSEDGRDVRARLEVIDDRLSDPVLRGVLAIVMSILGLVLVIACTNVANLLLAGAISRRREVGLRLALGASRWRVVRQLLTESVMLSVLSGGLGLLLAYWFLPIFAALIEVEPTTHVALDTRVYGFLAVSTLLAGIVVGLAPGALQHPR